MEVNWNEAPKYAEAYIGGFKKWVDGVEYGYSEEFQRWLKCCNSWELARYIDNEYKIEMRPDNWKEGEKRMEQIAQNGNGGEVYAIGKAEPSDEEAKLIANKLKYHREIKKGVMVDVYDVLSAFEVVNPAMQHALKKMLAPGKRGAKDAIQDMKEAIQSIERAIELESDK